MDQWKNIRIHNLFWRPLDYGCDFNSKIFWADFSACITCYDAIEVAKKFQHAAKLLTSAVDDFAKAVKNISWDEEKYYD